jgi:phosphohistidine phosphatase
MKTIILMRHAKSSWSDHDTKDMDRPLSPRGRICAATMGAWLAEQNVMPDHVILSTARRSKETWDRLKPFVGDKAEGDAVPEVYMAGPDALLDALKATPDSAETVVLIGHQPGLSALARKLTNGDVPENCSRAFRDFPTAATAVLKSDVKDWSKLKFGKAEFSKFGLPKEVV